MRPIDLRSDTVTRPTPEMRRAMAEAEVGDDVWGDDPTVIELEREVAAMLGKEAALYVPSGHMGNQVAIRSQTRPGDEILVHELAHVIVHEAGATAALAGVQAREIAGERGLAGPGGGTRFAIMLRGWPTITQTLGGWPRAWPAGGGWSSTRRGSRRTSSSGSCRRGERRPASWWRSSRRPACCAPI